MTDAQNAQTALDKLIEALKAGADLKWWEFAPAVGAVADKTVANAAEAYHGSLDAALALHEALLPGWSGIVSVGCEASVQEDLFKLPVFNAYSSTPARAWLLAILRAYRSTQP